MSEAVAAGPGPAGPAAAISARGLGKRFGPLVALHPLDLELPAGTALVVLGPNGAGKSTLLRLLAGLARPSVGSLRVGPGDAERSAARRRVGLVAHQSFLYPELTARENLELAARLYGVADPAARARALLEEDQLAPLAERRTAAFSRGVSQRLAIARARLHDPEILLLDEPFSGLDPRAAERLAERLAALRDAGHSLVVVSHDLPRAAALADAALVLARGHAFPVAPAAASDPDALARAYRRAVDATEAPTRSPASLDAVEPAAEGAARGPEPSPARVRRTPAPRAATSEPAAARARPRAPRAAGSGASVFLAVLRKDLISEWRGRDRVVAMAVFALLVVVIFHFAAPVGPQAGSRAALPGLLWVAYVFAAVLGLNRAFAVELENEALSGLALAPVDRGWIYLGKAAASFLLLGLVQALTALAFGLAFAIDFVPIVLPFAGVAALGAAGISAIGTLFSAMAVRTRYREVMLPLLLLPLLVPVLLGATAATQALLREGSVSFAPLQLLIVTDAVYLIVSFLGFEYVLDE